MDSAETRESNAPPTLFQTTHWSVVLHARDNSATALSSLCETYRGPLLLWLRCQGRESHEAEDLVQGFFAQLLRREFLRNVAPENGRFRAFLLAALKNFVRDEHSKQTAGKRGGGRPVESLDEQPPGERPRLDPPAAGGTPDEQFDRAWAGNVLAQALRRLERDCAASGHGALCLALEPSLFADETAATYREIAEQLGMSEGAVKMAALRIRERLRRLIREEILQTVSSELELEQELRYLISLFAR